MEWSGPGVFICLSVMMCLLLNGSGSCEPLDRDQWCLGSVGAVSAIDVEDVAGDESGFLRGDEHDDVGAPLRGAEPAQRNLRRQRRLVLGRSSEASQHAGVRWARRDGV